MAKLNCILKAQKTQRQVIFIHGLCGDYKKTWENSNGDLWIKWLADDIADTSIWSISYKSAFLSLDTGMGLIDRSNNIYSLISAEQALQIGEIILIGHSLGGLIIKQMIRIDYEKKLFKNRVSKVAFIATPHLGSSSASIVSKKGFNLVKFIPFIKPTFIIDSLVRNDEDLHDLNRWYKDYTSKSKNINHLILCETQKTYIFFSIVKRDSADPWLDERAILVDANHITISKPTSRDSEVYILILDFINKEVPPRIYSIQWFKNYVKKQIDNLGDRYIPDAHVSLPIANKVNALRLNAEFYKKFEDKTSKLIADYIKVFPDNTEFEEILSFIPSQNTNILDKFHIEKILELINNAKNALIQKLQTPSLNNTKQAEIKSVLTGLSSYCKYIKSIEIQILSNPIVLLKGEAGIGKSHFLADLVSSKFDNNQLSLFFLGQQFTENKDPFCKIKELLEIDDNTEVFLKNLNDLAIYNNSKILIAIDALNEGNGKDIWNKHLAGFINQITQYQGLLFIASIRNEYEYLLFKNHTTLKSKFIIIEHSGFSETPDLAIKTYFDYYKISYDSLPILNQEFSNPLFLQLLCRGFKETKINFSTLTLTEVYQNYFKRLNSELSEKIDISESINILNSILKKIARYRIEKNNFSNLVPIIEIKSLLEEFESKYTNFYILDYIISLGIVTKEVLYNNEEYIRITYEKLDDYLCAQVSYEEIQKLGLDRFRIDYTNIKSIPSILEMFAIILADENSYEIFEIFSDSNDVDSITRSFLRSLKWRNATSISKKVVSYINILPSWEYFECFFESLLFLSTKENHPFNSNFIFEIYSKMKMSERDSLFIPIYDTYFNYGNIAIQNFFNSCNQILSLPHSSEKRILAGQFIAMFLNTPNNKLRNNASRILKKLLVGNIEELIFLLKKYKNIDDPYIYERLYAVAFGCIVEEVNPDKIKELAEYVFDTVFNSEKVSPNILVRDYAKNVVEYASCKLDDFDRDIKKIYPPHTSEFPAIPCDNDIEKYNFSSDECSENRLLCAQMSIIHSMNSSFGDFGRYIFQSYFNKFISASADLEIESLYKIALKKVFDFGYAPRLHGNYDNNIEIGRSRDIGYERIGKKYQWLALYELASQVSDNYKMLIGFNWNKDTIFCQGSFEPNIRRFDPTLSIGKNQTTEVPEEIFEMPEISPEEWIYNYKNLPELNELLEIEINNKSYVLLNGNYTWEEETIQATNSYSAESRKNLWIHPMSYIVNSEDYDYFISELKDKNFWGRWLTEHIELYNVYSKEFYWSSTYNFVTDDIYQERNYTENEIVTAVNQPLASEWVNITEDMGSIKITEHKVLIPVAEYITERSGDKNEDGDSIDFYKPCKDIFETLKLKYGDANSILYNENGDVICFDSSEYLGKKIGFFIEKEHLFKYLKDKNYKIFWCIMGEKNVYTSRPSLPIINISGLGEYIDDKFVGKLNLIKDK